MDEHSDYEIMDLLKKMASDGKTVVIVTHNLANIEKTCDRVVVLCKNGYLAFCGTPKEAKEYFGVDSLGLIYPILEQASPQEWMDRFRKHKLFKVIPLHKENIIQNRQTDEFEENLNIFVRQVRILLERRVRIQLCDIRSLIIIGGQCLVVALLISLLFGNVDNMVKGLLDIKGVNERGGASATIVFLMVVSCLWFGCNNTAKEIVQERNIYQRERDVNLFPSSYLFSKLLFFGCVGSIQATVLCGIVCCYTQIDIPVLGAWIMMLLLTFVGTTIGLCVSIFSKSENVASALVPVVIIPQIILAGCVYPVGGILKIVSLFIIPTYWGYGGTGSLLDLGGEILTRRNLGGWTFAPAFFMLIFQSCVLIGISIWRLVSETTTLNTRSPGIRNANPITNTTGFIPVPIPRQAFHSPKRFGAFWTSVIVILLIVLAAWSAYITIRGYRLRAP